MNPVRAALGLCGIASGGCLMLLATACFRHESRPPILPYVAPVENRAQFDSQNQVHYSELALKFLGIPSLRQSTLPAGDRELRMFVGGGMVYDKSVVLRLVTVSGKVGGELYAYWGTPHTADERRSETMFILSDSRLREHGCRSPRRDSTITACRLTFRREPDWARVARYVDSLQVWTLPQPLGGTLSISDLSEMHIDRRIGSNFEHREYRAAEQGTGPIGSKLRALYEMMQSGKFWW